MTPKSIGIDGNEANIQNRVGVGQYAHNILVNLSKINVDHNFHIYLKHQPLSDMPKSSSKWHYHVIGPKPIWTKLGLPFHLFFDGQKLDFFYSPSHYSPHFSPFPTIPTIHDLGYLQSKSQFNSKDYYQLTKWTEHSIARSKYIIAVSEFTKKDIINNYKVNASKIFVVYNGVTVPQSINKNSVDYPYFLALGTLKPSKNYPLLLDAFSKYLTLYKDNKHKLIIAGKKGWLFDEIFSVVTKLQLEDKVIFTDYISEIDKWSLLKSATALVIPSTFEGFGIPAIESQSVGTPVIASDIDSLKEVLGDSSLFINPQDSNNLANSMDLIQQKTVRSDIIQKGFNNSNRFSWEKSAKQLLSVFDNI